MIIKQDLVKRIKEYFNLNIYETKVWLALLTKGVASAGEVAELSGVPRSRAYDVLESLEKRGFAITKIGKPVKYISVKPTEIVEKMKLETMQEAHDRVKILGVLRETPEYAELQELHTSGIAPVKPHDITGAVRGRSNVLAKVRELADTAEQELLICTSAQDFEDKSRVLMPVLDKLAKNNVKVKFALSGDADKVRKVNARYNLKSKHVDTPGKFFIADRKQALMMMTPDNADEEVGVWLNSPFFTSSLSSFVENTFKVPVKM